MGHAARRGWHRSGGRERQTGFEVVKRNRLADIEYGYCATVWPVFPEGFVTDGVNSPIARSASSRCARAPRCDELERVLLTWDS